MTGNGQFLTYNQGLLLAFLEPREQARADRRSRRPRAGLMAPRYGARCRAFCRSSTRSRCCKISTGAAADNTSGADVCHQRHESRKRSIRNRRQKLEAQVPGVPRLRGRPDRPVPEPAVPGRQAFCATKAIDLRRQRSHGSRQLLANSLQPELPLPDQTARATNTRSFSKPMRSEPLENPQDLEQALYIKSDDGLRNIPLDAVVQVAAGQLGLQSGEPSSTSSPA